MKLTIIIALVLSSLTSFSANANGKRKAGLPPMRATCKQQIEAYISDFLGSSEKYAVKAQPFHKVEKRDGSILQFWVATIDAGTDGSNNTGPDYATVITSGNYRDGSCFILLDPQFTRPVADTK